MQTIQRIPTVHIFPNISSMSFNIKEWAKLKSSAQSKQDMTTNTEDVLLTIFIHSPFWANNKNSRIFYLTFKSLNVFENKFGNAVALLDFATDWWVKVNKPLVSKGSFFVWRKKPIDGWLIITSLVDFGCNSVGAVDMLERKFCWLWQFDFLRGWSGRIWDCCVRRRSQGVKAAMAPEISSITCRFMFRAAVSQAKYCCSFKVKIFGSSQNFGLTKLLVA